MGAAGPAFPQGLPTRWGRCLLLHVKGLFREVAAVGECLKSAGCPRPNIAPTSLKASVHSVPHDSLGTLLQLISETCQPARPAPPRPAPGHACRARGRKIDEQVAAGEEPYQLKTDKPSFKSNRAKPAQKKKKAPKRSSK